MARVAFIMDKWRSYCSGIGICLILIAVIGICALHDQIYMWSLGDISDRYRQGMNAYREHDYDEARNRFILLAGIDSASYANICWVTCTTVALVEGWIMKKRLRYLKNTGEAERRYH